MLGFHQPAAAGAAGGGGSSKTLQTSTGASSSSIRDHIERSMGTVADDDDDDDQRGGREGGGEGEAGGDGGQGRVGAGMPATAALGAASPHRGGGEPPVVFSPRDELFSDGEERRGGDHADDGNPTSPTVHRRTLGGDSSFSPAIAGAVAAAGSPRALDGSSGNVFSPTQQASPSPGGASIASAGMQNSTSPAGGGTTGGGGGEGERGREGPRSPIAPSPFGKLLAAFQNPTGTQQQQQQRQQQQGGFPPPPLPRRARQAPLPPVRPGGPQPAFPCAIARADRSPAPPHP